MSEQYIYWQNVETPFFIIRQISFSRFVYFDRKNHMWKDYPDGFREVSLNYECHKISESEAKRIVTILQSTNTDNMSYSELCALVK